MGFLTKGVKTTTAAEKINTFQATKCEFGTPLPIAYGTCRLSPNLINYQDFEAQQRTTTVKTGKKSSSTTIDYAYYVYVELALCEGIIDGTNKIAVGGSQYSSLAELNGSGAEGAGLALAVGDSDQPTAYMESRHPDIAVGYKDMAYLYGKIYLGMNSASMPSYSVEVLGKLRDSGDGKDANPADIIIDLLTYVGLADYVDAESFDNYRKYCEQADLLVSTPGTAFEAQKKCQEVISELLTLTNSYMFWSVDCFKIVPRDDRQRGTWQPDRQVIYALSEDDFIVSNGATVTFSRKDSSERYNRFGVTFTNRENNYESETVFYENAEDIIAHGVKASSSADASWFHSKERAVKYAEMLARINANESTKYTFRLDWSFGRLEPGDIVTLTDEAVGLYQQPCMIESITEDAKGYLNVTAISRAKGIYKAPLYDVHENDYNNVNFNLDPHDTAAPIFIAPPKDLITSSRGLELWIALHGTHPNWGGCGVYASDKDGDYSALPSQTRSSTFGYTLTAMDETSDEVTVFATNPVMIELLSGSVWDADNDNTSVWIGGEFVSYEKAEVIDINTFKLTGVLRGRFKTDAVPHPEGTTAALCDGDLYALEVPRHYANRLIFFKFPAFNIFQRNMQSLDNLQYYTAMAVGDVKPPRNVEVLDTELLANGTRRFWWKYDYGKTYDTAGFEIRYVQGVYPNWETGIKLHEGLLTEQPFETDALRQGRFVVMIKAIDTLGQESEQAAYAVLNLGDLLEENVLYHEDIGRDGWSHVLADGFVDVEGNLRNKGTEAFWTTPGEVFWTRTEDTAVSGKISIGCALCDELKSP